MATFAISALGLSTGLNMPKGENVIAFTIAVGKVYVSR